MMIWYQSSTAIGRDKKWSPYEDALKSHVQEISSENVDWVFRGIDAGEAQLEKFKDIDDLRREYFVRNALRAESEGYVGFAVGCWQDHGYNEIRSKKKIPAISVAEATVHSMMMVGRHPGLIVPSNHDEDLIKNHTKYYGIDPNLFAFEVCTMERDLLLSAFADASDFIRSIKSVADKLLCKKVDVLAFGCVIFNEILYKHKGFALMSIPIMDCVGILVKTMEMMIDLNSSKRNP
jgi:allantoin racemase